MMNMNGCDEDTPRTYPPREEPTMVKRLCAENPADTTSEPWGRNAPPGAPVKALGHPEKTFSPRNSGSLALRLKILFPGLP